MSKEKAVNTERKMYRMQFHVNLFSFFFGTLLRLLITICHPAVTWKLGLLYKLNSSLHLELLISLPFQYTSPNYLIFYSEYTYTKYPLLGAN